MFINLTIKKELTFVNLPKPIKASRVAIATSFNAPTDFIFLLSDIVEPEPFDSNLKPIIGHLPTVSECYRNLTQHTVSQFYIKLEDSTGNGYTPTSSFIVELCFKDADNL